MNWLALRDEMEVHHNGDPQRIGRAQAALREAEGAVNELASLGHRFMLVPEELAPPQEWPKMLYHDQFGQLVVDGPGEMPEEEGWRDHPSMEVQAVEEEIPSKKTKLPSTKKAALDVSDC